MRLPCALFQLKVPVIRVTLSVESLFFLLFLIFLCIYLSMFFFSSLSEHPLNNQITFQPEEPNQDISKLEAE